MASSRDVSVTFLGSGDAFGSGGRLNTCFLVRSPETCFLIDCGASSLVAMKKYGVDRSDVDIILITHFHGDHFGGVPFFLLDARQVQHRTGPLIIAGPHGVEKRVQELTEALFPGASGADPGFSLDFVELAAGVPTEIGALKVYPEAVIHSKGSDPHGYRIECSGKSIAYSGDSEWTENLIKIASGTDLFICECSDYDEPTRNHIDYQTILRRSADLGSKRVILTHLGDSVLSRLDSTDIEYAEDGKTVTI